MENHKFLLSSKFQSLWSRAGSFDGQQTPYSVNRWVSIPLEQGGVFRPFLTLITAKRHMSFNPFGAGQGPSTKNQQEHRALVYVSIPLEQGRVFRLTLGVFHEHSFSFNPFRTGRGLSTVAGLAILESHASVSIPLEQGGVFRRFSVRLW